VHIKKDVILLIRLIILLFEAHISLHIGQSWNLLMPCNKQLNLADSEEKSQSWTDSDWILNGTLVHFNERPLWLHGTGCYSDWRLKWASGC
jgi:hypothetical protein